MGCRVPRAGAYAREAEARAAASHGMTVERWREYTAWLEASERAHRRADREMRRVPQYRG